MCIRNLIEPLMKSLLGFVLGTLAVTGVQAATVVSVQTALGAYKIELYEDLAPNTVARFLNDVESGRYHFSFVHFSSNTYFVAGRYVYNSCSLGPEEIDAGEIRVAEETGLANTTGTVAMVRDSLNPSTLTGEFLVNLGINTPASQSTAPIVIGTIIEGLDIADAVADQWKVPLDVSPSVPTIGYDGIFTVQCGLFNRDNLVQLALSVESVDGDTPVNNFDSATQRVNLKVDAGSEGLLSLAFTIEQTAPQVIIRALSDTVTTLAETVEGIATYDPASETLTIPQLAIDGTLTYSNMVFSLTDAAQLQFTLQSFTQN